MKPGVRAKDQTAGLSKSKFVMGLQCLKQLYLYCYHPKLRSEPDEATRAAFARGDEVGELARKAFAGGILVEEPYYRHEEAVKRTLGLMADKSVPTIFEGAFTYGTIGIRVDVLKRLRNDQWDLIEVKSSYRLYDTHIMDLGVQAYVVRGVGIDVAHSSIMLRNRGKTYDGSESSLRAIFRVEDLTERVADIGKDLPAMVEQQIDVLSQTTVPGIAVGPQCDHPYKCLFHEYCCSPTEAEPGPQALG